MSVANILDLPVNTYQKIDPLWDNAGGGGGLFLPLAGGSMNALPAGIINAHTLTGIINITGAPVGPGNDTVIQTIAGNDLSLQTANTEDISINTGQLTITAPIRCEINATTVIQPSGGYTYPNNPEVGLTIENFVNPTGLQMIGGRIDNITSAGQADGLNIFNIQSTGGNDVYGVRVDNIGNGLTTNNVIAVEMNNINGTGDATGQIINGVNGGARTGGISITNVISSGGQSTGIKVGSVVSNLPTAPAYGGFFDRGIKPPNAMGQLLRVFNGNLGLGVQLCDAGNDNVFSDAGNLVIIDSTAPNPINLVAPVGGFENGHWFLFSKDSGNPHSIINTNGADEFNSLGVGIPFPFGSPAYSNLLMFYNAGKWYANLLF